MLVFVFEWGFILLNLYFLFKLVSNKSYKWIRYYQNISLPLFIFQIFQVVLILFLAAILIQKFPFLNLSWLNLLGMGGKNVVFIGINKPYVGYLLLGLLYIAMPAVVQGEEEVFRKGTKNWRQGAKRSLLFGFCHMIFGVPLGGAIALTYLGLFLTAMYMKGGLMLSRQAHFQNNIIALTFIVLLLLGIIPKEIRI